MKISPTQYARTLYELTADKSQEEIDGVVGEFGKLLEKKNQAKILPKIIGKFSEIWNKENGIIEAEVMSAHKLENHQIQKVATYLKEKYKAKEVLIDNIVNKSIKGGVIIRVNDEVMDGSVERNLKDLRKSLVN